MAPQILIEVTVLLEVPLIDANNLLIASVLLPNSMQPDEKFQ